MKNLMIKELRLSSHLLSYLFLAFSLMTLIPSYPILVSAFFVCFGIFHTFQNGRETNDVLYTVLLPINKKDVVTARYLFVCFIQCMAFILMTLLTVLRMTLLDNAAPYENNAMMNSNPIFLAWTLLIFALFNSLFVGLYFKTAYKFGKPFISFIVCSMLTVCLAEAVHHIPGLAFLNTAERIPLQFAILFDAFVVYIIVTLASCRKAQHSFEKLDL